MILDMSSPEFVLSGINIVISTVRLSFILTVECEILLCCHL